MFRRLLLLAVVTTVMPLAALLAPSAANAATATSACSGTIDIQQFSFSPPSVPAGATSTLTLVAQNCTTQTQQGHITFISRFTWPGTGLPPGCPTIDPLPPTPYTIAAGAVYTQTQLEGDPLAGCLATGLQVMAVFSDNTGNTVAEATANLVIVQPTPPLGCNVTYTPNTWPGGFTASVTISNTGSATFNGWTLTFAFAGDEHISGAWNAAVTQTGPNESATNLSYNAVIAPGGSQSFGFQGTWSLSDAPPTSFSVNGIACT